MQLTDHRASNGLSGEACLITTPNLFLSARLNSIRTLEGDEIDFLHHVTQLDLRDNKLGELDATVFNNVEVLHCERNQLATLKVSGYFLKALYASCNGKWIFRAPVVLSFYLALCEVVVECSAHNQEALDTVLDKRVSLVLCHATGSSELQKWLSNNNTIWRSKNCENHRNSSLCSTKTNKEFTVFPCTEKVWTSGHLGDKPKL